MSKVYEVIKGHRSIRSYSQEMIKESDLNKIIEAATLSPTTINGQQHSIIVVKDQETKKELAKLSGGQFWIEKAAVFLLFVTDFKKIKDIMAAKGLELGQTDSIEANISSSVDIGISLGNAMNVAESLGYGCVPIGGIKRDIEKVIELFNLPEYTFPVVGLTVGVIEDNSQPTKPKMGNLMVHNEKYQVKSLEEIALYDNIVKEYMIERTNGKEQRNYSESVAAYYENAYLKNEIETMRKQGFKVKF